MAKAPKSAVAQLKVWGKKRLKMILWAAGIITALAATITTTAGALKYIEPGWYASRSYVREYAAPIEDHARIIRIQIKDNARERSALILESGKLELDMQNPDTQKLPQYRELAQKRLNDIKREIERIDEENHSLKKDK